MRDAESPMLNPRSSGRLCWLVLALWPVASTVAAETISRVPEIRSLAPEAADRALPVRISGTVTWTDRHDEMVVQEGDAAIWVHVRAARLQKLWRSDDAIMKNVNEGARVRVEGVTHAGGYAPVILPETIVPLGDGPVPPARPVDYQRFFAGVDAGLRIEVSGVVQGVSAQGNRWRLFIEGPSGPFGAEVARAVVPEPERIVDAEVRLRGVAASVFNTRGEWIAPRLITNLPDDLEIEKPAPPFAAVPLVPLERLHRFSPEPRLPHRVRIQGVVTLAAPQFCYVQEGDRAVRIESKTLPPLTQGDRVEALGFVETTRRIAMLAEADVRKIGQGPVPEPVAISPGKIVALNAAAADRGIPAQPHDFDGHLIRFRATLLAVQSPTGDVSPASHKLTLAQDGMILSAVLFGGGAGAFDLLRPQSEVELTGLAQLDYSAAVPRQGIRPARLDLILRSAADVVVVQAPSWWTAERLLVLAATIGLILVGSLAWVWQLHRTVNQKTHELAVEMSARRDAAIEFDATIRERNRLSANLHDTLLQTMSGLNYQLEACEAESLPPTERRANHLETARRMVQRGQEDLRGTVWALRVLPLADGNLADAIRAMANRLSEGHGVIIGVESEGELQPISAFVAGNLLLVAQEAVHNALKHAQATRIDVKVAVDRERQQIVLNVRDDGSGFAPESLLDGASRHFGLPGMRERIERLDGAFEIESSPQHGTVVRARVPLRSYDEDVA
jgi:signal transduction histidine kinase